MLSKRFLGGMASGAGSVFIKQGLNLALLPVVIFHLGVEPFGLYMMLVGLQELSLLLDLGFANASVRMLAGFQANGEASDALESDIISSRRMLMRIAHLLFALLGVLTLGAGLALMPVFPVWFSVSPKLAELSRLALLLMTLEGALMLYVSYYRALLLSHCQHQWSNIADTVYNIVGIGGGLALVAMGYGLPGLLLARLAGALVKAVIIALQACRWEPQAPALVHPLSLQRDAAYQRTLRRLLSLTGHAMAVNVSVIVSHKIDTLVIGAFLGVSWVGYYEMAFRLPGSALQLCVRVSEGVFPVFSRLMASGVPNGEGRARARLLFLRMSALNGFLIAMMLLSIVFFYPDLFQFFSADRMRLDLSLGALAVSVPIIWSGALQISACYFLYSADRQRYLTISSLLAALANLIISLALVHPLGIVGVALGTLIPQLIQHQFSLIAETCRELGVTLRDYLGAVHAPTWVILSASFGLIALLNSVIPALEGVGRLFQIGLISGGTFLLAALAWFRWTASAPERALLAGATVGPAGNLLKTLVAAGFGRENAAGPDAGMGLPLRYNQEDSCPSARAASSPQTGA